MDVINELRGFICQKMAIFKHSKFYREWKLEVPTALLPLPPVLCPGGSTLSSSRAELHRWCSLKPFHIQSFASSHVKVKNSMDSFSLMANVFEKIHFCYKSAWLWWNYIKLHSQSIWAIIWFYKLYQDNIFLILNSIISLPCALLLTEGSHTAKFTFHLFLCNNPLGLLRNTTFLMQCQHLLSFTLSPQKTQHESQMLQHAGVLDPLEC